MNLRAQLFSFSNFSEISTYCDQIVSALSTYPVPSWITSDISSWYPLFCTPSAISSANLPPNTSTAVPQAAGRSNSNASPAATSGHISPSPFQNVLTASPSPPNSREYSNNVSTDLSSSTNCSCTPTSLSQDPSSSVVQASRRLHSATSLATSSSHHSHRYLNIGIVVGVVASCVFVIIAALIALWVARIRKRRVRPHEDVYSKPNANTRSEPIVEGNHLEGNLVSVLFILYVQCTISSPAGGSFLPMSTQFKH